MQNLTGSCTGRCAEGARRPASTALTPPPASPPDNWLQDDPTSVVTGRSLRELTELKEDVAAFAVGGCAAWFGCGRLADWKPSPSSV